MRLIESILFLFSIFLLVPVHATGITQSADTFSLNDVQILDARDSQIYPVVKFDDQYWMAKNLNFRSKASVCYDNDTINCIANGRLYSWHDALHACPDGWHLPIFEEFRLAGLHFSSLGSQDSLHRLWGGFDLKLSGQKDDEGGFFRRLTTSAFYWTADGDNLVAYAMVYKKNEKSFAGINNKQTNMNSVRCVRGNFAKRFKAASEELRKRKSNSEKGANRLLARILDTSYIVRYDHNPGEGIMAPNGGAIDAADSSNYPCSSESLCSFNVGRWSADIYLIKTSPSKGYGKIDWRMTDSLGLESGYWSDNRSAQKLGKLILRYIQLDSPRIRIENIGCVDPHGHPLP